MAPNRRKFQHFLPNLGRTAQSRHFKCHSPCPNISRANKGNVLFAIVQHKPALEKWPAPQCASHQMATGAGCVLYDVLFCGASKHGVEKKPYKQRTKMAHNARTTTVAKEQRKRICAGKRARKSTNRLQPPSRGRTFANLDWRLDEFEAWKLTGKLGFFFGWVCYSCEHRTRALPLSHTTRKESSFYLLSSEAEKPESDVILPANNQQPLYWVGEGKGISEEDDSTSVCVCEGGSSYRAMQIPERAQP